jgi:hypothetical protein
MPVASSRRETNWSGLYAVINATDALVISHACGTLSVLRFSPRLARFVTVQRITVGSAAISLPPLVPGEPPGPAAQAEFLVGGKVAADPLGRAVAVAARKQRVAMFFAAAYVDDAATEGSEALKHAQKV